jgi:RimJ/RimL family protein N-acetyltransferase
MTELTTTRLVLRPLREDDAPAMVLLFRGDWEAVKQTGRMPYPPTVPALRAWIEDHLIPCNHPFLIRRREDGVVLGGAGFGGEDDVAELGYSLGRPHWGQGYATEAVHALIGHARALGWRDLEAFSFVDNPASARVLEKTGFTCIGVVERDYPLRGGARAVRHYRRSL